jgi:hypothetical protein
MSGRRVIVMGAGVAGMTVAHELVQRGFDVTLLERRAITGGKARTFTGNPETRGHKRLPFKAPVEHGFHFFPGFYRNLDETLKRIPTGRGKHVYDALRPAPEELFGFIGRPPLAVRSMAPETVGDAQDILGFPDRVLAQGLLTREDLEVYAQKLWQLATSCRERRDQEYEAVGWRTFVGSLDRSEQYYWYLASGLTRALVAAQGSKASTKTIGDVGLRILGQMVRLDGKTDRVLAGPADEVWFKPWIKHLTHGGLDGHLDLRTGVEVTKILCNRRSRRIEGVVLAGQGRPLEADYYVSALPVEKLSSLVTAAMRDADGDLDGVRSLAAKVPGGRGGGDSWQYLRWMSGIQFFLREKIDLNDGHQMLLDTPWGLSSINQQQLWDEPYRRKLRDLGVRTLLSVEISSWDAPGLRNKKTAMECSTREEIAEETWYQLRSGLSHQGLPDFDRIKGWFLDDESGEANEPRGPARARGALGTANREPILVNHAGAQVLRPQARTRIRNFFLAGDFVRTDTDLACMESANESGRRAANALLEEADVATGDACKIFTPRDPWLTAPLRWMDETRFEKKLPWSGWDMGKWIVRGIGAIKKATDVVFGPAPAGPPLTSGALLPAKDRAMAPPEEKRVDWDPRFKQLDDSVRQLEAAGPSCADLVEARKVLEAARESANLEALRDELAPPRKLHSANNRSDSLFAKWRFFTKGRLRYLDPVRGVDFRKEGQVVPVPFQIYDADALVVHGSADLRYLEAQMAGTGLEPVRDQNGKGYVEVWIMNYPDACVGPHQEAAIHVVVADKTRPAGRAERVDLPEARTPPVYRRTDGFDCVAPMMNSENKLYTLAILLTDMRAIAYGEQLFGIGKFFVDGHMHREHGRKSFAFAPRDRETGAVGRVFFEGTIRERDGLRDELVSLAALTRAVGTIEVARDLWQGIQMKDLSATMIGPRLPNFEGGCGDLVEIMADYKFTPTLTRVSKEDKIRWTTSHPFGRHLARMRFEPQLLARDRHLRSVLYARDWVDDPRRLAALAYAGAEQLDWVTERADRVVESRKAKGAAAPAGEAAGYADGGGARGRRRGGGRGLHPPDAPIADGGAARRKRRGAPRASGRESTSRR